AGASGRAQAVGVAEVVLDHAIRPGADAVGGIEQRVATLDGRSANCDDSAVGAADAIAARGAAANDRVRPGDNPGTAKRADGASGDDAAIAGAEARAIGHR